MLRGRSSSCPANVEACSDDEGAPGKRRSLSGRSLSPAPTQRGFLEVFSGSQTLSTVFVTAGHPTRTFDIKDNDDEDMHDAQAVDRLLTIVKDMTKKAGGRPPYVHLAPPCCTYSNARYPKIRSSQHPSGLPSKDLPQKARATLKYANAITDNTLKVMTRLVDMGVPHTIEQPWASLMQKEKSFKRWAAVSGAGRRMVDQCMFGMPYRKRTALWCFPNTLLDGLERQCNHNGHAVTLSKWDRPRADRPSVCLATNMGSSAYPIGLCQQWYKTVVRNLASC